MPGDIMGIEHHQLMLEGQRERQHIMYTHEVAIVVHDTEQTIKTFKVESEKLAKKLERVLNINLDHRFYYTEVRAIPHS